MHFFGPLHQFNILFSASPRFSLNFVERWIADSVNRYLEEVFFGIELILYSYTAGQWHDRSTDILLEKKMQFTWNDWFIEWIQNRYHVRFDK